MSQQISVNDDNALMVCGFFIVVGFLMSDTQTVVILFFELPKLPLLSSL